MALPLQCDNRLNILTSKPKIESTGLGNIINSYGEISDDEN